MPDPIEPTLKFTLELRESLFAEVKENMRFGVKPPREFTDDEATAFLAKHLDILGSIVRFDEVDTTERLSGEPSVTTRLMPHTQPVADPQHRKEP